MEAYDSQRDRKVGWCYFKLDVINVTSLACATWRVIDALSLATFTAITTESVIALACDFSPLSAEYAKLAGTNLHHQGRLSPHSPPSGLPFTISLFFPFSSRHLITFCFGKPSCGVSSRSCSRSGRHDPPCD